MKMLSENLKTDYSRSVIAAGALGAALVFIAYLTALQNGFVNWDDQACVYENPNIRFLDAAFFRYAFTAVVNSNWHPLTVISYAIDHALWGLDPAGYHLTNNIFHSLNAFLFALITGRLLQITGKSGPFVFFTALMASLFFGLHPLRVESVAWVSERKDMLSGFFFLLSINAYMGYALRTKKSSYAISLIAFFLALLSKPMAVTLPVVLLILDYYPLNRIGNLRKALTEKLPFFIFMIALSAVTIWAQGSAEAIAPLDVYPITVRIYTAVTAYAFYLYKTVMPTGLAPFYPRELEPSLLSLKFMGSLAILLAVTVFTAVKARTNRAYLTAWLLYIVTLLPVAGLVQVGSQSAADRYTYIPLLPFAALLSAGLALLAKRAGEKNSTVVLAASTIVISIALGYLTIRQTKVWKDSISLWSREIEVYPDEAPIGYVNLGLAYKASGDLEKAVYYYDKAIAIDPYYSDAYVNRGAVLMNRGDTGSAIADLSEALRLNPANIEALGNRGIAYLSAGDLPSAIRDMTEAIERNPSSQFVYKNYYNRASAFRSAGDLEGALKDLDMAIMINPVFAEAYNSRGLVYLASGRLGEAASDISASMELDPSNPIPYFNLGLVMQRQGEEEKAAFYFNRAAAMGLEAARQYMEKEGIR